MPAKKRTYSKKKRSYKRPYKKRSMYRGSVRTLAAPQFMANYPNNRLVKMKACIGTTIDPIAGALVARIFRANQIFDIGFWLTPGLGANAVMGLNEWAQFFMRGIVVSSKIKFRILTSSGTAMGGVIALRKSSSSDALGGQGVFAQLASGGAKSQMIQPAANGNTCYLSDTYVTTKFFGINDLSDNAETYGMDFTGYLEGTPVGPSDDCYWILSYQALDQLADLPALQILCEIEYSVLWSVPRPLHFVTVTPPELKEEEEKKEASIVPPKDDEVDWRVG